MMWYGDGMGWGAWTMMIVTSVLFWGALFTLVVWGVRSLRDRGTDSAFSGGRAEEVLAERFARGEIDEEEYTRRRAVLAGAPSAARRRDPAGKG